MFDVDVLVGLNIIEAAKEAKKYGYEIYVVEWNNMMMLDVTRLENRKVALGGKKMIAFSAVAEFITKAYII